MRGKHARPSEAGKLAEQATRVAPVVAVAGAMLGMPYHVKPPPRITPAEHVVLDASVKPTTLAKATTYTVQPGDTLYGIAEQFYHDADWTRIWDANKASISTPNLIYPGQQLVIPDGSTISGTTTSASTSTTSATTEGTEGTSTANASSTSTASAAPAQSSSITGVPGVAGYYIQQAALGTGLPASVVAAQNNVESSYGQNMGPSSAGAMGPWQFMPGTWSSYSSAPFSKATSWPASTQAYIALMKQLLQWSGGNMRMALAAYNAGTGGWQAGLGYADQILSMAGH